jgi:hypothetical protein
MKPETIKAIQRAKAYVHYKRLEKDQSEDNQAMANDLAFILEALSAKSSEAEFPSPKELHAWRKSKGYILHRGVVAIDTYEWIRERIK